jgi:hypothetical protein
VHATQETPSHVNNANNECLTPKRRPRRPAGPSSI